MTQEPNTYTDDDITVGAAIIAIALGMIIWGLSNFLLAGGVGIFVFFLVRGKAPGWLEEDGWTKVERKE